MTEITVVTVDDAGNGDASRLSLRCRGLTWPVTPVAQPSGVMKAEKGTQQKVSVRSRRT